MNLKEAKRRVNALLERRGDMDGEGGWYDQNILDAINDANTFWYRRLLEYGGPQVVYEARFTYDADAQSVSLAEKLGTVPAAIWDLGVLPEDDDVGPDNLPVPVNWPNRAEIDMRHGRSFSIGDVWMEGKTLVLPRFAAAAGRDASVSGSTLRLRPIPEEDEYLFIRYSPELLPTLTFDDQELMGGLFHGIHQLVSLRAARELKVLKGEATTGIEKLIVEFTGQNDSFLRRMVHGVQRQQPGRM